MVKFKKARKIENGVARCHMVDVTHGVSVVVSMTVFTLPFFRIQPGKYYTIS